MDEKNDSSPFTYTWGEFYETLKEMERNGDKIQDENLQRTFALIEKIEQAQTFKEIEKIIKENPISEYEQKRINSICLDGLIAGCKRFSSVYSPEYIETGKFMIGKFIIGKSCSHYNINSALNLCLMENNTELALMLIPIFTDSYLTLYPVIRNGNLEILKALYQYKHHMESHLVNYAIEYDQFEIFKFFLENNLCEIRNTFAKCVKHNYKMTKYMLDTCGISLYTINVELCSACRAGAIDIIKLLIEYKADIHFDDNEPLKIASEWGRMKVVKLLLKLGATVTVSAISRARTYNRHAVVELLRKHYSFPLIIVD